MEAVILIEVAEESPRVLFYNERANTQAQRKEFDFLYEVRERVRIKEEVMKQRMALRYNKKMIKRNFTTNGVVLIQNNIGTQKSSEENLATKRPYKIVEVLSKGSYKVFDLQG
ncbi:hypothetical protein AHAS_Ahas01G0144800 [Arachis hypogaea]